MLRESKNLGVGARIAVRVKAFGEKWAKSTYPGELWKTEILQDLEVIAVDPPVKSGDPHIVHVQHHERIWKIKSTQVKVMTPAPPEHRIGLSTQSSQQPAVSPPSDAPGTTASDVEDEDEDDNAEDSTGNFSYTFEPGFTPVVSDFRQSPKREPFVNFRDIDDKSPAFFFRHFLPVEFIKTHIIPATNEAAEFQHIDGWVPLDFSEFMAWCAAWFAMTFVDLPNRRDYWNTNSTDWLRPAMNFGDQCGIPFRRFNQICQALALNHRPAATTDRFWEVRELLTAWNSRMREAFHCGWSTCLDESMMQWDDASAPGWMFVPRKFTTKGNEFHTIACTQTKIVFGLEIVEGKDRPGSLGPLKFQAQYGKTPALLLRITEESGLWGRDVVVNMDSGFCVLDGLLALKEKGIYAFAIIKKKRYWPKNVDGEALRVAAANIPLGQCLTKQGECKIGQSTHRFFLLAQRDSSVVVLAMSTQGTIHPTGKLVHRGPQSFRRPAVFDEYYMARHSVDDNNNLRQGHRGVEAIWETRAWSHRIFAFILGLSEANSWLAWKFFQKGKGPQSHMEFRAAFVNEIFGAFRRSRIEQAPPRVTRKRKLEGHTLQPFPPQSKLVNGKWEFDPQRKKAFPQRRCQCKRHTRYYCSCAIGKGMCKVCFGQHISEVV